MPIASAGGAGGGGGGGTPDPTVSGAVTLSTGEAASAVTVPETQVVSTVDPNTGEVTEEEVAVDFSQGAAVALINTGATQEFRLCSAFPGTGFAGSFFGFLFQAVDADSSGAIIVSARGSKVTALVVGDADLVPGNPVFLGEVAGRVTQTPPETVGTHLLKIGFAVAVDQIILAPDFPILV